MRAAPRVRRHVVTGASVVGLTALLGGCGFLTAVANPPTPSGAGSGATASAGAMLW